MSERENDSKDFVLAICVKCHQYDLHERKRVHSISLTTMDPVYYHYRCLDCDHTWVRLQQDKDKN
jgi:hypothetical protein